MIKINNITDAFLIINDELSKFFDIEFSFLEKYVENNKFNPTQNTLLKLIINYFNKEQI